MSFTLPIYTGEAPNLVRQPDPIATLADLRRVRITRADNLDIVFDVLGAQPNGEEAETVINSGCAVCGGIFETLEDVVEGINNPALPQLSEKEIWDNFLEGYVTVEGPNGPLNLKANRQARNDFMGQETLIKSGLDQGEITNETPVSLWDKDNVEHAMTAAQCRLVLFRYGYAWHLAFTQLAP